MRLVFAAAHYDFSVDIVNRTMTGDATVLKDVFKDCARIGGRQGAAIR
ncbi:MAG: hypothetical protein J6P13_04750 [Kiritimatiellae bacterium]|nr:hypothetical protein [Kiritimatiellia bacterium]